MYKGIKKLIFFISIVFGCISFSLSASVLRFPLKKTFQKDWVSFSTSSKTCGEIFLKKLKTTFPFSLKGNGKPSLVFDASLPFDFRVKEKIAEAVHTSEVKKSIYIARHLVDDALPNMEVEEGNHPFFKTAAVIYLNAQTIPLLQGILKKGSEKTWHQDHMIALIYHELGHVYYEHIAQASAMEEGYKTSKKTRPYTPKYITQINKKWELEADAFVLIKGGISMGKLLKEGFEIDLEYMKRNNIPLITKGVISQHPSHRTRILHLEKKIKEFESLKK